MDVYEYLKDIAGGIINGKSYDARIELDDGGYNSYIAICVYDTDFNRPKSVTQSIEIFRHTNSASNIKNTWCFKLGNVCHPYKDNPDIPLCFESYGVSKEDAEAEAQKYFIKLKNLIQKKTSEYKSSDAESKKAEREALLLRLKELDE